MRFKTNANDSPWLPHNTCGVETARMARCCNGWRRTPGSFFFVIFVIHGIDNEMSSCQRSIARRNHLALEPPSLPSKAQLFFGADFGVMVAARDMVAMAAMNPQRR